MVVPGGPPPAVPPGWQVSWSDQYNQWFYIQPATGASQWEHPSSPPYATQHATTPQPGFYPPPQPQYAQQGFAPQQGYYPPAQPQYAQHGFTPVPATPQPAAPVMPDTKGKLGNLDAKGSTALAVGGGLAAGALLQHEIEEFSHHGSHNHVLGTISSLIGAAGVGALGSKLFGGKGHGTQATPPPPAQTAYAAPPPGAHVYPAPHLGAPTYPVQNSLPPAYSAQPPPHSAPSSGPGLSGLGGSAIGGVTASYGGNFAHSGPRLIIHAAAYADRDVTDKVKARVTPDQVLAIENWNDEFGDPWPETERKMFSVLYQFGDRPLEVWASSTTSGKVDIRNEALANARMAFINKNAGRIICLIWGEQSILSNERVEKLERDGELDCSGLGNGGFYPWEPRNLICYYKDAQGGIGVGHGRENGTMRLPWNPLAKWS